MMKKKKIVHFTHVSFLDTALEHIKAASLHGYELHVLIGLSPNQLKANVLNLDINVDEYTPLAPFEKIKDDWNVNFLAPYFNACKSVHFVVYPSKKSHSLRTLSTEIKKLIKDVSPDFIHLDEFMTRQFPLLPFLIKNRKKLVMNIHDPKMHSGEFDIKRFLLRQILFRTIPKFVVFAQNSHDVLVQLLPKGKKIYTLGLRPTTVYQEFCTTKTDIADVNLISFVGRISQYKGIELFLESINTIHQKFPDQEFMIAGKPFNNYKINYTALANSEKVTFIERHLSNKEIAEIIDRSQLVVCPYIDATQSGIVLVAHGLNRPVLVTPVGGLPDYVEEGLNGIITKEVSAESLSESIIEYIEKRSFEQMSQQFVNDVTVEKRMQDYLTILNQIYTK